MHASSVGEVLASEREVADGVLYTCGQQLNVEIDTTASLNALLWCDSNRLAQALNNVMVDARWCPMMVPKFRWRGYWTNAKRTTPSVRPFRQFAL